MKKFYVSFAVTGGSRKKKNKKRIITFSGIMHSNSCWNNFINDVRRLQDIYTALWIFTAFDFILPRENSLFRPLT